MYYYRLVNSLRLLGLPITIIYDLQLGKGDIVRALLSSGADPGIQDKRGETPVQVSSSASITAIYTEDLLRATAQSEYASSCNKIIYLVG